MPTQEQEKYNELKWLLERLQQAEDYCKPYFERAKRYYRLYRFASAVEDSKWPYVNRVRTRDILAFVEDSTALLIQTLFATMPFFSVIPRETSRMYAMYEGIDPIKIGKQLEECLDYQISHEHTEFFEEMVDFFKGGCMLGNSYVGVYPRFSGNAYLRPLLKTVDYWDVLPIPYARRLTKAKGCFIREFMSSEELQDLERQGIYRNTANIKGGSPETEPDAAWHRNLLQELGMEHFIPQDDQVEVLHYFSGGHVMTLGDRKEIMRDSREGTKPLPYDLPLVQYKYMPVPLEFFAMGIPEVLEVLQEDKNLIRSARRDNIDLVINKIVKARIGGEINYDLIKYYAGAIWPLENLQDLEPVDIGDVTQSSYLEEEKLQADMENALSLFGYARGMTPKHTEQPTTVLKLQQASLNRLDLAIKLAEFTTLQNIATRIILLTRRFMSQPDYEAIIGDKDAGFFQLEEEHIRRFFHFKPMGSSVTNIKELRQQQIQFAMQLIAQVPPQIMMSNIQPFTIDYFAALRTAFESLDIKNIEEILIKLQEPMPQPQIMPGQQEMQGLGEIPYGGMM